MTYAEYKTAKQAQDQLVTELSDKANSFETNEIGLVKEEVRNTTEYRTVKGSLNREFKKLQVLNTFGVQKFKKEMAKERSTKYLKV